MRDRRLAGSLLAHGFAARPAAGERRCGDQAVVLPAGDATLVGVVDGLGHGPEAADAATVAVDTLTAHAGETPQELLGRCHHALRRLRGAAISLGVVTAAGSLEWVGVGNVQGALVRSTARTSTRLPIRGGIVGMRLPKLRAVTLPLAAGDVLVMFTDGVDEMAVHDLPRHGTPDQLARHLMDRHALDNDDALVLVARYRGQ